MRIQQGDIDAFQTAYETFYDRLYFYILKCTGSQYLAEEIVQQTFIKIWESRHRLSLSFSLSSQLFRTAKSLTIDLLRKEQREKQHTTAAQYSLSNIEDGENNILYREDWLLVKEKIETLAPVRKKIFKLSRLDGLSYNEIAKLLSISPKTVENHIVLALKQLRTIFLIVIILLFA